MIHVLATISTTPGKRAKLVAAFEKLRPLVLAEEGCIEYGTAIDVETPIDGQAKLGSDALMVVEKWESIAHLQAHLVAPHMDEFREANGGIIAGLELQILEPASAS